MDYQIKINSEVGTEIITTADVKDYARITTTDDDTLIGRMITQARIWAENYISKDIVSKNRSYYIASTNGTFDLPFAPVTSISEITINGTATTDYEILGLDNTTIELDAGSAERVKITYITSGISDSLVKQALLQLVATYYDNRSDFEIGKTINMIPTDVTTILQSYKTMYI